MLKNAIAYILRKRNRTCIVFIILTLVLSFLYSCLNISKSTSNLEKNLYKISNTSLSITKNNGDTFETNQFKELDNIKEIKEIITMYDGLARTTNIKVVDGTQLIERDDLSDEFKNMLSVEATNNSEKDNLFIYIWGILNECASETEYGRKCYAAQFELIRKMDTTRPCSFASCRIKNDICLDLPDVVSFNIYPQWYLDIPVKEYLDDLYEWIQDDTPGTGKPFLITETGAGGLYGYRNPEHSKWTEEYQAYALEKQLTSILANSGCMGVYIWQFCDNRVSEECFAGRPRTMNNKGIVDEFRRHKLSYDVVKRIYQSDI